MTDTSEVSDASTETKGTPVRLGLIGKFLKGTEIDTRNSIRRVLRDFRPGEFVTVVVARNGQGIELKLPLVTGE